MPDSGGIPKKKRIVIPAWWSIIALIMAGLVIAPIQVAKIYGAKAVPQEAPAPVAVDAPKQDAEQAKPASEQAAETKPVEKAAPAAVEAPQPKQNAEKAEKPKPAPAQTTEAKPVEKPAPAAVETPKQDAGKPAKSAPEQAAQRNAAPLKEPVTKQKAEEAIVYRVEGKDTQGRAAAFDIIVVTNGYAWAKGGVNAVVFGGKVVLEAERANRVLTPKMRELLAPMSDLIAVGRAPDEGKKAEEEARAVTRSKTVAAWIKKAVKPETALWTLTLGQYEKTCTVHEDQDLNFEQPVVIGVRSKAEGTDLRDALSDAISGRPNFPSRDCYSRFDMTKTR
jgi:hypothetical protein